MVIAGHSGVIESMRTKFLILLQILNCSAHKRGQVVDWRVGEEAGKDSLVANHFEHEASIRFFSNQFRNRNW